jgi:hypothetical protein
MDEDFYKQLIEKQIQKAIKTMFDDLDRQPDRRDVQYYFERATKSAFQMGQSYALENLLTIEDIAKQFQITKRRAREVAKSRHARFGIGRKIPGKRGQWLFLPGDLDILAPIEKHRKKNKKK